jgi:site-specific DNA-adenine methylase
MKAPLKSNIAFKGIQEIRKIIPPESTVSSFLFYDGQIETSLASTNRKVVAHTNRYAIYEFWMHLLTDRHSLAAAAAHLFPIIDDTQFYLLQEDWNTYKDPLMRSALFFILNRASDSGRVSQGTLRRDNFNPASFALLQRYNIENLYPIYDQEDDFIKNVQHARPTDFLLLPVGQYSLNLFEHGKAKAVDATSVHHRKLAAAVNEMDRKVILLYKKHPALFALYDNYNIQMVDGRGQPASTRDECEEMIIVNF